MTTFLQFPIKKNKIRIRNKSGNEFTHCNKNTSSLGHEREDQVVNKSKAIVVQISPLSSNYIKEVMAGYQIT
jgi:hypothetical protein